MSLRYPLVVKHVSYEDVTEIETVEFTTVEEAVVYMRRLYFLDDIEASYYYREIEIKEIPSYYDTDETIGYITAIIAITDLYKVMQQLKDFIKENNPEAQKKTGGSVNLTY